MTTTPRPGRCCRCGRNPAGGYAKIGGDWYCHDETGPDGQPLTVDDLSCYELAQLDGSGADRLLNAFRKETSR